jgi:hypothetical protein
MPLSDNKKIVENSEELIVTLRKIFGKNPGVRPGKFQYWRIHEWLCTHANTL